MIKLYKLFFWVLTLNAVCCFAAEDNPSYVNYIKNKGQWDNTVLYQGGFKGGSVFLEKNAFTYVFYPKEGIDQLHHHRNATGADALTLTFHTVRMQFLGSLPNVKTEEQNIASFYHNYYKGNDPSKWASNVPLASTVLYTNLYNGISVKTFSSNNNVRYDFLVAPGADISQIKMKFEGQNNLYIKKGNLFC